MGKDYYSILEISRSSSQVEIRKAYHKKALEYHPDKNNAISGADKNNANSGAFFTEIAEAYDVLNSNSKRKIFDAHGEAGLKDQCNYQFMADPMKIFQDIFFGDKQQNKRPRMTVYSEVKCSKLPPNLKPKDKPIIKDLRVSLEELHCGAVKRIKITKKIESSCNPGKVRMEEKILEIKIRPGWKEGTRITFENEGNISQTTLPSDLIFVVKEKKHPQFERRGDDLVHRVTISLKCCLVGTDLALPTIDGTQKLHIRYDHMIQPGQEKVVLSHGMTSQKDQTARGNLIIKFLVRFPEFLDQRQKDLLSEILPD